MKKEAQVTVKMYPELKQRLQAEADAQDRSVNWLAGDYIKQGLERDEALRLAGTPVEHKAEPKPEK